MPIFTSISLPSNNWTIAASLRSFSMNQEYLETQKFRNALEEGKGLFLLFMT